MPVVLHEKCRTRLTEVLASVLSQLKVNRGQFIADYALAASALVVAEKVLPVKGEVRTQLGEYIDHDRPLTEFALETLSDELSERPFTDAENQPLTEISGYEDSQALAKSLVDRLVKLPHRYTLSFPLPSELFEVLAGSASIDLSDRVRIVKTGESLSALYPPTKNDGPRPGALTMGLLGALGTGFGSSVYWNKEGLYLQVDVDGYIGPYGGTSPHLEAVRVLRSFCGLGLSLGLFEIRSAHLPSASPSHVLIHRQQLDGTFVPVRTLKLSDGLSRTVESLAPNQPLESLANAAVKSHVIADATASIRIVLSGGKKADLIFLAAQWFFDGYSQGSDQLLKFVQTMVVLEILLGDKASSDQTGLNVLLGNRCAYLIGNSQEDRAEVLEWFQKIYDVRSKIVHSGKHRLSALELELFARLRWICRRVIHKEIDLLRANKKDA